jgi:hypothetical protein
VSAHAGTGASSAAARSGFSGFVRIALGIAGIAALMAGCGGRSPGGGSGESIGTTVGAECDSIGATYCRRELPACLVIDSAGNMVTTQHQCVEVGQALCAQYESCGGTMTQDTCMQQAVTECCASSGTCDNHVLSTESAIEECAISIAMTTCAALEAGAALPKCSSVILEAPNTSAECESQVHDACCGTTGTCGMAASSPQSAVDECNNDLETLACGKPALPSSCQGVVVPSSFSPQVQAESAPAAQRAAIGAWMQRVHPPSLRFAGVAAYHAEEQAPSTR